MSNQYFHFKQFTIHQDRCAMKVSTDACIQGAWAPILPHVENVLDIGTGTGLLSLMLAQRNSTIHIDAIELDGDAATQARENVQSSPWANRINIIQADARSYGFQKRYDMVICNPPFFNNSLLGDDDKRNSVRHTLSLSYADLFSLMSEVLNDDGYAVVLLPVAEHAEWEKIVNRNGWSISDTLLVQPRANTEVNRVVSVCTKQHSPLAVHRLTIYDASAYTDDAIRLLQPYYQKL